MLEYLASLTPQRSWPQPGMYDSSAEPGPAPRSLAAYVARMVDEVDCGMLLLDDEAQVLFANAAALAELDEAHPLQIVGRGLRARHGRDVVALHDALSAATRRGLQRLLPLGQNGSRMTAAVRPFDPLPDNKRTAVVTLGKRGICEYLSLHWFARVHKLTAAETAVLQMLCQGTSPEDIATERSVEIATVRSQIASIRAKTDTASILQLVHIVCRLPPMVGAVRPMKAHVTMSRCEAQP